MRRRRHPRSVTRSGLLALAALVPLVVSACISVSSDEDADDTPAPAATAAAPAGSPTLPPLVTPAPTPTPEPTPEPVDAEVVGFIPGWLLAEAEEALDPELLTIAAIHSIEAAGNGRLVSKKPSGEVPPGWKAIESEAFGEFKERLQAEGVKVVPVIQRVGWTEGAAERTATLLSKRRNRKALADRIARYVSDRGFDGVNLDVEPVPARLADEYVQLVRDVRTALDAVDPELHLSVDVLPGLSGYDLAGLVAEDAADMAVIMGYNIRTDGAAVAGSTAPLRDDGNLDLARSVAAAVEQIAAEQVVLALPWYGKAWATESADAGSATKRGRGIDAPSDPHYGVAVGFATQAGRNYDARQASAWTAYPDQQCASCPAVWRQVWYDDPESFAAKVEHAIEQGLGGVGIWALGMDAGREEMWQGLRSQLRPVNDRTAPGGSASLDPEVARGEFEGRESVEGSARLRLFARDDPGGSGLLLARLSLDPEVDEDGALVLGRSYPAGSATDIDFPLGDPATGGSAEPGPRDIHVQWRDLAGNWSAPLVIETYALDPETSPTPADLG
jgi:spore germination protein YaaH